MNPGLKLPLSTALHRAKRDLAQGEALRDRELVLYTGIKINREGAELNVSLRVGTQTENSVLGDYLTLFCHTPRIKIKRNKILIG